MVVTVSNVTEKRFLVEIHHSEVANRPVTYWRFQDEHGVWSSGLAADPADAAALARRVGYTGENQ